jgi:hypothetical protein
MQLTIEKLESLLSLPQRISGTTHQQYTQRLDIHQQKNSTIRYPPTPKNDYIYYYVLYYIMYYIILYIQ